MCLWFNFVLPFFAVLLTHSVLDQCFQLDVKNATLGLVMEIGLDTSNDNFTNLILTGKEEK